MLRIGILLPRSSLFPSLGLDILNGLKQNLKQQQLFDEVKLITDNIGFGIDEQEIYTRAEKMLLQEDADVVMVCADVKIAEMLQPLFTASSKILLMVNAGANFPDSWQPAPTTITHSLGFCMHAQLTGKLAATETNKQAANVISYYDGGYRQCYCMLNGHQQNGGVPRYNHITHLKLAEFTLEPLTEVLEANTDISTLLCLFAGEQAEIFYKEILSLQQKFGLTLYVSPMMFETSLKDKLGNDFSIQQVKGFVPWIGSLENDHNKNFKEAYTAATGQPVNYFSLLGWETGLIVSEIIRCFISGNTNATAIVDQLKDFVFESPRGWLKIDPATHYSYGPSYLAVYKNNMMISVEEENTNMDAEWQQFSTQTLPPGESSSWRNTYLCI